ncbi:HAMP domain-containing histidine kinase [bacterium]|jgi:two-component system phosphate regulon sensor histidine kinase PhoR|nr:HAMP domain-containing histidine kinase [bacterium]MDA7859809.1 HAMP domain-containing histidine kinase [Akkermansiaceae bacterium]MDB4371771.1 HAMP domain-containing histidine kinase [bacterium]MDB4482022.1 HAMP domain-containing histidine kinase [Akkermansiaceae bacterium]MDB4551682.1 HAMP domain-containing histidine kinase [bacterium]
MTYFAFSCVIVLAYLLVRSNKRQQGAKSEWGRLRKKLLLDARNQDKSHNRDLQQLLDALPQAFFSITKEGVVNRINSQAGRIFDGRDILNKNIDQVFLDSAMRSLLLKKLSKLKPARKILRFPPNSIFSSNTHDKDSHWEIEICPLSLLSKNSEIQLMMRDITASVHSDQVRQDFVANASHELRTPLSVISGYLEHLTEEGGLDQREPAQKMLGTMDRHVVRINRIVDDMLLISKLESDDFVPLNLAPFCIATCVRDVIERLELVIKKQKSTIEMEVAEFQLIGDQFYWTQILFNLVENALKQNPSIPLQIRIHAESDRDDNFKIHIADNGIGIPATDLPFIFKRFYRVEKHHSQTQVKGTGLGLSIVKRAVEAHGGTITATSTPGIETIFTIAIPKSHDE